ncbi:MAG: ribonuclease P protein component [Nitriliruptorales bacterium]|nr:ribonuclease P protein component [Nitriliruptorales bacterium]
MGDTVAEKAQSGRAASASRRRARTGRLRLSRDVREVFATGRATASPLAVVHVRDRHDGGHARATVVAGRNVGSAVERNRVKRRLRAIIADLPLRDGADYVVVGRNGALSASAQALYTAVAQQADLAGRR